MRKVDIIIPIYNAYEYTKKCIETVIQYTNLKENNLVLVEDQSPDKKIKPMLKEFVKNKGENHIILLENDKNLGFVKSVNRGMTYSKKNDVLILNSDTEVTKNWLNKIRDCAYRIPMVGTVTPLSNNGTIASVPNYIVDNPLPEHMSLEAYAALIEQESLHEYPEIPTGNGFCMYMTRQAIDTVGILDDDTFEKGYGEENDFCYRCLEYGYKNLLCDDTFIYHKGTQSFSKEKESFILSHLKILEKRYPICYKNTDDFAREYPIDFIQKNVKYATNIKNKKNVLLLVHDFRKLEEKNLGGTTLHLYDIINSLSDTMNFHVLYPDLKLGYFRVQSFFAKGEEENLVLRKIENFSLIKLYNPQYREMVEDVLSFFQIDLVHIHHLKDQYLDIYQAAFHRNIPIITTLHDFYCICPTIQLLDANDKYCGDNTKKDCKTCLQKRLQIGNNMIHTWRQEFSQALALSNKIIVPSNNTKEVVLQYYKELNIDVIEHGIEDFDATSLIRKEEDKFNIAFVGGISEHKGIGILKELIQKVKDTDVQIHLFGTTNDAFYNQNHPNYIYHGIYDRADINCLLIENNIHLVCLFSIWPETYSYTLTESLVSHIPVISFKIGAIAERLEKMNAGYLVDRNASIDAIYEKILDIKKDKKTYQKKVKAIQKAMASFKTIQQMAEEYETIYHTYIKDKTQSGTVDIALKKKYLNNNQYRIQADEIAAQKELWKYDCSLRAVDTEYRKIINSKRWKFINKISITDKIRKLTTKKIRNRRK